MLSIIKQGSTITVGDFLLSTNIANTGTAYTITLPAGVAYNAGASTLPAGAVVTGTEPTLTITLDTTPTPGVLTLGLDITDIVVFSALSATQRAVTVSAPGGDADSSNDIKTIYIETPTCVDLGDCFIGSTVGTGLIYGAAVWQGGLVFDVTATKFAIEGATYTTAEDTLTLSAADPTNPRIDVLVANTDGTVSIVAGTPAATPVKPAIDTSTQVELTSVTIPASGTAPTGLSEVIVYQENAGTPTEWAATESTAGARIDTAATANPDTGTIHIRATAATVDDAITLTPAAAVDTATIDQLSFRISPTSYWTAGQLQFQFFNGTSPVSSIVSISHGGYLDTNSSAYQLIAIDGSEFVFSEPQADSLVITVKRNAVSFDLDEVYVVSGSYTPLSGVQSTIYTADGTIMDARNVYINGAPVIFDGMLNSASTFTVQDVDNFSVYAQISGGTTDSTFTLDRSVGIGLSYQPSAGGEHGLTIGATSNLFSRNFGDGDAVAITLSDTGSGTISLDAATYIYGDGAGANLPADDSTATKHVVVDTATGQHGLAPIVEHIQVEIFDGSAPVTVGDGVNAISIPAALNGYDLTDVLVTVEDKGVTGTTDIQVRRWRAGVAADMLTTPVTVGDEWFANDGVINTANDDVATGDRIYIDRDAIHSGTAPNGLSVVLTFTKV